MEKPQEQLVLEFKELKIKHEQLIVQNKSNLEKIGVLKKQVLNLQSEAKISQKPKFVDQVSVECQTTLKCEDCNYPSKDLIDLGEHQYQCHAPDEEPEKESMICYLCGWKLQSKQDLMVHRKEKHKQHVRICQYYELGCCDCSDVECWYKHEKPQSEIEFKCTLCEKTTNTKAELIKHRKINH